MRSEKRQARMGEIEAVAYKLFAQNGFEGTSMLAVAKEAKASNETMYRWYGDKHGLFESMVKTNAADSKAVLEAALAQERAPMDALAELAPVLLGMLLGDKAILLNRAAASDPTGKLGALLAQGGRENVLPLIRQVLVKAVDLGEISPPEGIDVSALFVQQLVGDTQIRRVIGTLPPPSEVEVQAQAERAVAHFLKLSAR